MTDRTYYSYLVPQDKRDLLFTKIKTNILKKKRRSWEIPIDTPLLDFDLAYTLSDDLFNSILNHFKGTANFEKMGRLYGLRLGLVEHQVGNTTLYSLHLVYRV